LTAPAAGRTLARNTVATVLLRLAASAMSFGIGVLAARLAGVSQYGGYSYAMSIVAVGTVVATIGLDRLVVRAIATQRGEAKRGELHGFLRWAQIAGIAASIVTVGIAALLWPAVADSLDAPTRRALMVAAVLLPLSVWIRVQQSALQGLDRMIAGQLPESVIQPAVAALALISLGVAARPVDSVELVSLQTIGAVTACGVGAVLLQRSFPRSDSGDSTTNHHRDWGMALLPLMLTGTLSVATNQADMLILGAMKGAESAGVYAAAIRSAGLIGFVLASANLAMAPTFASLHSTRDIAALQRLVTRSARYILLLTTPIAVLVIVGGRLVLLVFGAEFASGVTSLRILGVGQWANAAMGSVAFLLMMTGHARDVTVTLTAGLIVNVALSVLLIPQWGIGGAATAATVTVIFWNAVLGWFVRRRLGIDPTAAGILPEVSRRNDTGGS
jgi:O-antigen/teichoic acid export membrane protein